MHRVKPEAPPFDVHDLRQIKLFHGLPADALARVRTVAKWCDLKPGEVVSPAGDGSAICFALSGAYRVSILSPSGQHVTIRTVRQGDHFGDVCAFSDLKQGDYSVIVDAPGMLLQLTRPDLEQLMNDHPQLTRALLASMANVAVMRSELIYQFAILNTRLRLVAELLRLAQLHQTHNDEIVIKRAPTHEAIATQIGATREGITRHMKSLAQQGLIQAKRGEISILDAKRMRAMLERASGRRAHQAR